MHQCSITTQSAESSVPGAFLSERHLQVVWFTQKYLYFPLKTSDGRTIEVLSPGIWNSSSGPDFLRAHLRIEGREVVGDIELHLFDEGWKAHGHDLDSRYNDVILHVALWKQRHIDALCTASGESIAQCYLEEYLTIPTRRILQLIDLDLYPYRKFIGSGRCAHGLFKKITKEEVHQLFRKKLCERWLEKAERLGGLAETPAEQVVIGMGAVLGYKKNGTALQALAAQLFPQIVGLLPEGSSEPLQEVVRGFALKQLLTAAGLPHSGVLESHVEGTFSAFSEGALSAQPPLLAVTLSCEGCRPLNHPIRRLVALSFWLADLSVRGLYDRLLATWRRGVDTGPRTKKERAHLCKELIAQIPSYSLEESVMERLSPLVQRGKTLISKEKKQLFLVNVFFPLLYKQLVATCLCDAFEIEILTQLLEELRPPSSGKLLYLRHRFFGDHPRGAVLNTTLGEQSAFQLHYEFCQHFEASCRGCPFVDRYWAMANFKCASSKSS